MKITIYHNTKQIDFGLLTYDNKTIFETNNKIMIKKSDFEFEEGKKIIIHLIPEKAFDNTIIKEISINDIILIQDND